MATVNITSIVSPTGYGAVQPEGINQYETGATITFVATPAERKYFVEWQVDGQYAGSDPAGFTYEVGSTDAVITAKFRSSTSGLFYRVENSVLYLSSSETQVGFLQYQGGYITGSEEANKQLTQVVYITESGVAHIVGSCDMMFRSCINLLSIDLSYIDTSAVEDMSLMFEGCTKLQTVIFSDKFKTSNVTLMTNMFKDCTSLLTLDVSNFEFNEASQGSSKFVDVTNMFVGCTSLTSICSSPYLNWADYAIETLTSGKGLFYNCTSLKGGAETPTEYSAEHTDLSYARLDKIDGTNPGYFSMPDAAYIELTVNPTGSGEVQGYGKYKLLNEITIKAESAENYKFRNWTKANTIVSTDKEYKFTPETKGIYSFVANFTAPAVLQANILPDSTYGTVEGTGEYRLDFPVKLTAIPTENSEVYKYFNYWSFVDKNDSSITYTPVEYISTASKNPYFNTGIVPTKTTRVYCKVELDAYSSSAAWVFGSRDGGTAGVKSFGIYQNSATSFKIDNLTSTNQRYTQNVTSTTGLFELSLGNDIIVIKDSTGSQVSAELYASDTTSTKPLYIFAYNKNDSVESKLSGKIYSFKIWDGAQLVKNYIPAISSSNIVGLFDLVNYEFLAPVTSSFTAGSYKLLTEEELEFTPYAAGTYTFNANFRDPNQINITAVAAPNDKGSISPAGTTAHTEGTKVTYTAIPLEDSEKELSKFVNWTLGSAELSTNKEYTFTAPSEDFTLTGNFRDLRQCEVVLSSSRDEGSERPESIVLTGEGTYTEDDKVTITASVVETSELAPYKFLRWETTTGEIVSYDASYTFTAVNNIEYVAIFESLWKAVHVAGSPAEGGTVIIEDHESILEGYYINIYKDELLTIVATPTGNSEEWGYYVDGWLIDGIPLESSEGTIKSETIYYTITSEEDLIDIKAVFVKPSYYIEVIAKPLTGGEVTGSGLYTRLSSITLTATPNDGYYFDRWEKDGITYPDINSVITVTVLDNAIYSAYFKQYDKGGGNKDVILTDETGDVYPLAHSDSNGEVIADTYQRKEVNEFIINSTYDMLSSDPISGKWVPGPTGEYYIYKLGQEDYPEVVNVKSTDRPIWDIEVDPTCELGVSYINQIKYRAQCTTLETYDGYMLLMSTNIPGYTGGQGTQEQQRIKLLVTGLNLQQI